MFRFRDNSAGGIDWDGLREDLQEATPRSAVLLHVSGSIPSGAEFTAPQWRLLTAILHVSLPLPCEADVRLGSLSPS